MSMPAYILRDLKWLMRSCGLIKAQRMDTLLDMIYHHWYSLSISDSFKRSHSINLFDISIPHDGKSEIREF